MGYVNKAELSFQGITFEDKIRKEVEKLGIPCFISAAVYQMEEQHGWELVEDEMRDEKKQFIGPIGGLLSSLRRAQKRGLEGLYTVPCDMPLFHKEQIQTLKLSPDIDAVIWQTRDGKIHPVCGYYADSCIPYLEEMVKQGNYRLRDMLGNISVKVQKTKEIHLPDKWFFNINHVSDYSRLQKSAFHPPVLAVSGKKNSGKTTLLIHLLREMSAIGIRCAVIKHDGHDFEADVPGTDSYKLKKAGAYGTAVYSKTKYSVVKETDGLTCERLIPLFEDADIIFLEGQKNSSYSKIEILRTGVAEEPVTDPSKVLAYVTDGFKPDPKNICGRPVVSVEDLEQILEIILTYIDKSY